MIAKCKYSGQIDSDHMIMGSVIIIMHEKRDRGNLEEVTNIDEQERLQRCLHSILASMMPF